MAPQPPRAAEKPHDIELHGIRRSDPYHWLKDPDWQAVMREPERLDPEIRAYLEAENAYTATVMAPEADLQTRLIAEMKGRIKEQDASVPKPDGAYAYYHRFEAGGEHPVFCRRDSAGREELLLDANAESQGQAFYKLAALRHSPDHRRIAYAVDLKGSEFHEIRVKDLESGDLLPDRIGQAQGDLVWAADGASFLYCLLDRNHRPCKVLLHRLGSDPADDLLLYEEKDPGFFLGIGSTESRRFLTISAHDHTTSEIRLISADDPKEAPRLVAPRAAGIEYEATDQGNRLLILTNADGAVDFKIATAPIPAAGASGTSDDWQDLLPHEPGRYIIGLQLFKDYLVRAERRNGLPRLVVRDLADDSEHSIAFAEEAYSLALDPGFLFETPSLRFTYSSMTTPLQVYDYDMASRERTLLKEQEIPSGHDPAAYVTRRIFATAADGEQVPVSLLHRRDTAIDGSAPLLLYGYGSYGMAMPASFSGNRLSLVDRGFVYAIAHIRGGSEMGYGWYLDGKLAKKTNSFHDFIAAAEALI
ncbi:MAG TPA: S9 family peptidase, partial [Kiloniellaceae bacterium]|nr:S9 family peptidase [Kiloniellaceae bacterium]